MLNFNTKNIAMALLLTHKFTTGDIMTDISSLSRDERDALAQHALRLKSDAKARAEKYRAKKLEAGFTQISVWVPKAKAADFKRAFDAHVTKKMSEATRVIDNPT
jgi:hypothetical protein